MIKQNPFSVYDFLGYFVPGSILVYAYLIINYSENNETFDLLSFLKDFSETNFEGIFFFVILSYSLGHLLNFASSISIEKYAIWTYGFPSKYLLKLKHKGYWKSCNNWKDMVWRIVMILVLFPCVFLDFIIGHLLGFKRFYTSSLDPLLRQLITYKINCLVNLLGIKNVKDYENYDQGGGSRYDFHRIVTHYAYENSKTHQAKMSNYVALYGFLRALCFIFNLLTYYYFLKNLLYCSLSWSSSLVIACLSLVSYLSFMAFMKFYRRYSLEGLMVITIDKDLKTKKT